MTPIFFKTQIDFRKWLKKNYHKEKEILVGFYKVDSGRESITWPQSVDEALCFGWIDGIRRSIDKSSYCIRFTPRKKTSIWSTINIQKADELIRTGLMQPAGLELFQNRDPEKSKIYSFENERKELPASFRKKFKSNKSAWNFFVKQAPSYQKTVIHWIMAAKREPTQHARLTKLIIESSKQKRIV